ncbi:MAG: rRNA pseudouridine synthase [Staphylococcus equorum]|uniref:Pseudouridine synthase n=1 Tax=Staphylococcus equorum TaxID=246432 RepID=A0AAW7AHL0_9STAP|nr:pseudouridine synthase [Staphylococcus equorum]KKI54647.1 Ribosomal small subunit pseudouridine synthase A [Staphylococcus equorum subsp. equorum]MDG0838598.1 rRNA pseudouridine synthase [Staphylococcus equorum]MDK9865612.1 pseudouridine synthase [Staphylococcus equorum]MDK9871132.1 pseudouridine synthase [Staphylococcus equorum]MDK9876529.1 pseudouridine synthase [Staphylococcus equorum]
MRIDKFLANMGVGTRTEVKQLLKKGNVTVNDKKEKSPKIQINPETDIVSVNETQIQYIDKIYLMLNKPKGYLSATEDNNQQTVIDLVDEFRYLELFPVGRLDKDTEGLLLITNDGQFNHQLMSPTKHVSKTYEVISEKTITKNDIESFKTGIELNEGLAKPAQLVEGDEKNKSFVTIYEGRYHQVKRMFHAIDNEVLALKRISIGDLKLDSALAPGEFRHLTQQDFKQLGLK